MKVKVNIRKVELRRQVPKLSQIENFICDLFKITPNSQYYATIFFYQDHDKITTNHIISVESGETFVVVQDGKNCEARSIRPITKELILGKHVLITGTSFAER